MKEYKLKIYCDFDGTVTKNDVWVSAIGKFIKNKKEFAVICEEFESNVITSRECSLRELALVEDLSFEQLDKYLEDEELDDYFREFLDYCNKNNYEITLLSEGLDYYIRYVLEREKLDLKYYSNKLLLKEVEENGKNIMKLTCEFTFPDEHCSYCGMSKRNVLINNTNDLENEISVYIGDGTSDFCVSNYADIVFAKKSLASYCGKNNITYHHFNNFKDVIIKLEQLKSKNKIKHKLTAKNLRKDVFLGG